jgi:hypothetical protein
MTLSGSAWPSERVVMAAQQGDEDAIALLVSGSHAHVHATDEGARRIER